MPILSHPVAIRNVTIRMLSIVIFVWERREGVVVCGPLCMYMGMEGVVLVFCIKSTQSIILRIFFFLIWIQIIKICGPFIFYLLGIHSVI